MVKTYSIRVSTRVVLFDSDTTVVKWNSCFQVRALSVPAISAPVERLFRHGGIFVQSDKSRLSFLLFQVLLPRYRMDGLNNFDKIVRECSLNFYQ